MVHALVPALHGIYIIAERIAVGSVLEIGAKRFREKPYRLFAAEHRSVHRPVRLTESGAVVERQAVFIEFGDVDRAFRGADPFVEKPEAEYPVPDEIVFKAPGILLIEREGERAVLFERERRKLRRIVAGDRRIIAFRRKRTSFLELIKTRYPDDALNCEIDVFLAVSRKVVGAKLIFEYHSLFDKVIRPFCKGSHIRRYVFGFAAETDIRVTHNEHIAAFLYRHLTRIIVHVARKRVYFKGIVAVESVTLPEAVHLSVAYGVSAYVVRRETVKPYGRGSEREYPPQHTEHEFGSVHKEKRSRRIGYVHRIHTAVAVTLLA